MQIYGENWWSNANKNAGCACCTHILMQMQLRLKKIMI